MFELSKLGAYLLSPLVLALGLWLCGALCLVLRWRTLAIRLAAIGFAGLWISSLPVVEQALTGLLQSHYVPMAAPATPPADAIVVLGGAVSGRHPPSRPSLGLHSSSTRVWYAAELYRAGKAKWVIVAAGGEPASEGQQIESDAIAEMLVVLGVPETAIQREAESRNTRENAANTSAILDRLGARRVLLVTSAQHMHRAVKTFTKVWAGKAREIIPAPTDAQPGLPPYRLVLWIPSPNALVGVTNALKEYAGMVVLAII